MNYSTCRIGQATQCESKGCCEWLRVFGASCACGSRGSAPDLTVKKEIFQQVPIKKKKVPVFELVNENKNEFQIPKQDDWIKKIKVKL